MNFNEMKLAIYESYTDGEISKVTCDKLISSLDSRMGNICVKEMVNAENEFIRASISVVNESADYDYLTEAAKTFSEKVKAAWKKFKDWIKSIIDKLFHRKDNKNNGNGKLQLPQGMMAALNTMKAKVVPLLHSKGAKIAGIVVGIIAANRVLKALLVRYYTNKALKYFENVDPEEFEKTCNDIMENMYKATENMSDQFSTENGSEEGMPSQSEVMSAMRESISTMQQVFNKGMANPDVNK